MTVTTLEWIGKVPSGRVRLIDQTLLPSREEYLERTDYADLADDIRRLAVRGAPAIGVAAAFGVVLGVQGCSGLAREAFMNRLNEVCDQLAGARPTAVNLFWAIDRMRKTAHNLPSGTLPEQIIKILEKEALEIFEEDRRLCRAIGENGAGLIQDGARVLTHCNAGALATAGIGTALAAVYVAARQGKKVAVYADETRPLLQGARLTAWELHRSGIDVTLICDNMAASVMAAGKVDLVITGADRIAANGDAANKIGTHGVAILAARFGIPFYVAAPFSTFDLTLADGSGIPIEERSREEVAAPMGCQAAPDGVKVFNPAFDVTPAELIAALITDRGVIRPPYRENIARMLGGTY